MLALPGWAPGPIGGRDTPDPSTRKGAEAEALAADRVAEHEKGKEPTKDMATVIGDVAQGAEMPRDLFERLAREYLDFNRRHREKEEARFLPPAESALSAEEGAAIEAASSAPEDPLFGPRVEERYRRLLKTWSTPAPEGWAGSAPAPNLPNCHCPALKLC